MFWELLINPNKPQSQIPQEIIELAEARIAYLEALEKRFPRLSEEYTGPPGHWHYLGKDNPMVALTVHFQDGASLKQKFSKPISQADAMAMLGAICGRLGSELNITLPVPLLKEMTEWIEEFMATLSPTTVEQFMAGPQELRAKDMAQFLISKLEAL